MLIMQSPSLMRRLGIRDYEKLSEEMKETMNSKQEQERIISGSTSSQSRPQDQQNLAYPGL